MTNAELQSLIADLARTPEKIRQAIGQISGRDPRWKPKSQAFSALENVCHLRDIEREGHAIRIARLLQEDQPFLPNIDGDRLAIARRYNEQNLDLAFNEFIEARQATIRILKDVSSESLNRSGTLETGGVVSVEKLLLMIREHDEGHIRFIHELAQDQELPLLNVGDQLGSQFKPA
ncbi:MAG TPA: DinB family protein [Bdellovibrionota bacterium]|nr:DinB family protein [Bdellovibrionota bacterium]